MHRIIEDISGQKFNRLTAIRFSHRDKHGKQCWVFKCDCGVEKNINLREVKRGRTKSCGCAIADTNTTHGHTKIPLFNTWRKMIHRCYNPNSSRYDCYGGRGITVCDEWKDSFLNFYRDVGERPGDQFSLDRINNDLGYSKDNCRWATRQEQHMNRRSTLYVQYNGEKRTVLSVCEELGMNYKSVVARISVYGWRSEEAISTPIRERACRKCQTRDKES